MRENGKTANLLLLSPYFLQIILGRPNCPVLLLSDSRHTLDKEKLLL